MDSMVAGPGPPGSANFLFDMDFDCFVPADLFTSKGNNDMDTFMRLSSTPGVEGAELNGSRLPPTTSMDAHSSWALPGVPTSSAAQPSFNFPLPAGGPQNGVPHAPDMPMNPPLSCPGAVEQQWRPPDHTSNHTDSQSGTFAPSNDDSPGRHGRRGGRNRTMPPRGAPDYDAFDTSGGGQDDHLKARLKSERQQALNKAAQQRYRERKKAKAMELEHTVSCLQDKVQELATMKAEKEELQGKVDVLEKQVILKEAKIAQLNHQVEQVEGESKATAVGPVATNVNTSQIVSQYHSSVATVRTFLQCNKYGMESSIEDVTPENREVLLRLVQVCYSACSDIHRSYLDADVFKAVEASSRGSGGVALDSNVPWSNLRTSLRMKPDTLTKARALRGEFVGKITTLFSEQQALKLEVLKSLLPEDVGGMSMSQDLFLSSRTTFSRHQGSHMQHKLILKLRASMVEEQKLLMELDYLVMLKLLDPLQSAKCYICMYPKHCDIVSLLNCLVDDQDE